MAGTLTSGPGELDTSACDAEPIQIPGSIQPHGALIVLDGTGRRVLQVSENLGAMLGSNETCFDAKTLVDVLGREIGSDLLSDLDNPSLERSPLFLRTISAVGRLFHAVAHRLDGLTYLELEASTGSAVTFRGLYPMVRTFLGKLTGVASSREVGTLAVEEVRRITGFDRALLYRFDEDGHGTVLAEDRNETLPSYLGLRFPESDIPRQARDLYKQHRLRLIADAHYRPVPIAPPLNPETGEPTDLSYCALRSVSPVHVQYMKNMGTDASMSISVLRGGELWGLISCHNQQAKVVPFEARTACDFLGQVLSAHLEVKEHNEDYAEQMRLKEAESNLLRFMAGEEDFLDGLRNHPAELLEFAGANGAAVVVEDQYTLLGETPVEAEVRGIVDRLILDGKDEVYATDSLAVDCPGLTVDKNQASGLLAIAISKLHRGFILWFRPEVIQTVAWGGDPRRQDQDDQSGNGRIVKLSPRNSFEIWKERVNEKSLPWRPRVIGAATELRNAIINIVVRKAEEVAALTDELTRSNKELEAFSYSVSHDLRAPLRHVVGYAEMLRDAESETLSSDGRRYIETIIESADYAGTLVDNLLRFSRVGRTKLIPVNLNMDMLIDQVKKDVMSEATGRKIDWKIEDLPPITGDLMMLRLAFRNVLSNALKYTSRQENVVIEIGCRSDAREHVYFVKDNGVGFDMAYVDKLFGVFQRLHRWEEFEGTGIGLANVRRIVERHHGRAWAEGAVGRGATLYLALPRGDG